MSQPATLTIELLDTIQDAFNRHDVAGILSHFADDCVWLMARGPNAPEGRRCVGKQEIGDVLLARYDVIGDMRWDDMRHWICGDTKALSEWTVRGTMPDGSTFEYLGCDLWEFHDGKVVKKDTYWKFIEPAAG
jgi:taurine dehydrogenase small subunit